MPLNTTIPLVTPSADEVSAGPVPSTAGWRHSAARHMLARLARVLELRAPDYAAGDPSPCCHGELLHPDPYDSSAVFCPEDGTVYGAALP
jgi:hypothetical protein